METYTVNQFQENFDELFSRVEKSESFIIEHNNKKVLIAPYKTIVNDDLELLDEFIKNQTQHDDAC